MTTNTQLVVFLATHLLALAKFHQTHQRLATPADFKPQERNWNFMKFLSALSAVGRDCLKVINFAAKVEDNTTVQSLESALLPPAVIKLISTGLDGVANSEAMMAAEGFQNGTGPQKLAIAAQVLTPAYAQYVQENAPEVPAEPATIVQIVNLLAQVVNLIPAATVKPQATATAAPATETASEASAAPAIAPEAPQLSPADAAAAKVAALLQQQQTQQQSTNIAAAPAAPGPQSGSPAQNNAPSSTGAVV